MVPIVFFYIVFKFNANVNDITCLILVLLDPTDPEVFGWVYQLELLSIDHLVDCVNLKNHDRVFSVWYWI